MGFLRDLGIYFGVADDDDDAERRRKGAATVGLLPEDPDDPPKQSFRELLWTCVLVVLVLGVHLAIPEGWSFWQQAGAYLCAAVVLGLVLRTWAIWYGRRGAADPPSTDEADHEGRARGHASRR